MLMSTHASLLYFSGTGNSYRAAVWTSGLLNRAGIDATVTSLVEQHLSGMEETSSGRITGVFLPTHGFTAPWTVIRNVLRMPRGDGSPAFVVSTRAGIRVAGVCIPGMEGTAAYLIALILALKGYRIRGVSGLDMPSNWMALHWGLSPANAGVIIARAQARMERFIGGILQGNRVYRGGICLALGLLLSPVSFLYLIAGRFFLAKLFFADNRCTGCELCATSCPCNAIRMQGKKQPRPYWTFSCESCMRCMGFCPEHAVQATHSGGVLLWYATHYILAASAAFLVPLPKPFTLIAGYFIRLGVFFLTYILFWLLGRIPLVNRLFSWTTLTRIYRRYHEPETSVSDLVRKTLPGK
jgi:Pyruvate/2-oxoacid:ferredoxin oxidoreductase delta subunit